MPVFQQPSASLLSSLGVWGCTLLSTLLIGSPAQSAEELSIKYGAAQRSISVADLNTFVTTGEIPRSLQWYAERLTEEEQATLRAVLKEPFALEPNIVTTFVKDSLGEALLRRLLVMFYGGPSEEALLNALRSSLVLAVTDEEGFTVMNAIRKYPLTKIRIDLTVALDAAEDLKEILFDTRSISEAIRQKGAAGITAQYLEELTDFSSPMEPGMLEWEREEIVFSNPERESGEVVKAEVYLPLGLDSPAPTIVVSHGVASGPATFAYLAEHLASHGFAVATIRHPDTDELRFQQYINGFADQPDARLFVQRPHDITALLDDLEQKVAEDPRWQGQLRTDEVGLIGHSLGGYTVLASGGAQLDFEHLRQSCQDAEEEILPFNLSQLFQCELQTLTGVDTNLRDDRVAAVFAVSPITSSLFGPVGMSRIEIPTMMVAASEDLVAPAVDEQIVPFTWLETEDRYLVLIENATHFSFFTGDLEALKDVPEQLIGPVPELAKLDMQWMATTFFEAHLNGSGKHQSFLTEISLPSETGDFEYALTRSLTQEDLDSAVTLTE